MKKRSFLYWFFVTFGVLFGLFVAAYWPVVSAWNGRLDDSMIIRGEPLPGSDPANDLPTGYVVVTLGDWMRSYQKAYLPLIRAHASLYGYDELPPKVVSTDHELLIFVPRSPAPIRQ